MSDIQALEQQLNEAVDTTTKIDLLNKLAFQLRFPEFKRAINLADEAYTLSKKANRGGKPYPEGLANSLVNLSWFNSDMAQYELALSQATEALSLFEKVEDADGHAKALRLIGRANMYLGNYHLAIENHLQQLSLSQQTENKEGEASALNALGTLYSRLEKYEDAIESFLKAQRLYQELDHEIAVTFALVNCAICHNHMGEHEKAIQMGIESLEAGQTLSSVYVQTWSHNVLGTAYTALKQYDLALENFEKTLAISATMEKTEQSQQWLDASISISKLYNQQSLPQVALQHLSEALAFAETSNTKPHQHRCHEAMAESYKLAGDFESALRHYEAFHQIKEEVIDLESSHRLKYLNAQYQIEAANKETEIYQLHNAELKQEILARKKIEESLRVAQAEALEAQLEAERANRAKSAFLSNMSHELRTPLNAILGFGQLLEMDESLTEEQAESVDTILSSGNHLLALISEILDLSKIEAGKLELQMEPCTISHVVDAVTSLVQMQAKAKELDLVIDIASIPPVLLMLDETRLSQILVNLLHNSIKFTNSGEIRLAITPLGNPDELVPSNAERHTECQSFRFEVQDSGVGMSKDELEIIFSPFEQVGHAAARAQGTGLGLTITKRLVELMGGTLIASSDVGIGSTFSFELAFDVIPPLV